MHPPIRVIAHNIRSLWNVGSFFRTCDALGVEKLYLTGYSARPPRREITKTALGAETFMPWEYVDDPMQVVSALKKAGWNIVSLEQCGGSVPLAEFKPLFPLCLIVGNEIRGVQSDLLTVSDTVVHIPMLGRKESLNVAVAVGIALSAIRSHCRSRKSGFCLEGSPATLAPAHGRSGNTTTAAKTGRSHPRRRH